MKQTLTFLILFLLPLVAFAYRDLDTGTFMTRDPAGMVDGPNEYTYVKQNPWSMYDEEGLGAVAFGGQRNFTDDQKAQFGRAVVDSEVGMVAAASVPALALAGPEVLTTGIVGRVAVAGISGIAGAQASNTADNLQTGKPISHNASAAIITGGISGVALQGVGELAGPAIEAATVINANNKGQLIRSTPQNADGAYYTPNQTANGTLWVANGKINQNDTNSIFANNPQVDKSNSIILTGVHGSPSGAMSQNTDSYGYYVYNNNYVNSNNSFGAINVAGGPGQISARQITDTANNSAANVIADWCYSGKNFGQSPADGSFNFYDGRASRGPFPSGTQPPLLPPKKPSSAAAGAGGTAAATTSNKNNQ